MNSPGRAHPPSTPSSANFDVVIVGSGIGGLSTAIYACARGLRPLVLEWSDKIGGSTSRSFGGAWVANNDVARERGLHDHRGLAALYMYTSGAGRRVRAGCRLSWTPRRGRCLSCGRPAWLCN